MGLGFASQLSIVYAAKDEDYTSTESDSDDFSSDSGSGDSNFGNYEDGFEGESV